MGWLTGWTYRTRIIVTEGSGTTLLNFQVGQIDLQGNNPAAANYLDFSLCQSDGADIRITKADGTTVLPHWHKNWNPTSKTAELFFEADILVASSNTDFYLYYGNSGASNTSSYDDTMTKFPDLGNPVCQYHCDDVDEYGQLPDNGPNGLNTDYNNIPFEGNDDGLYADENFVFADGDCLKFVSTNPFIIAPTRAYVNHDNVLNLTSSGTILVWTKHDELGRYDILVCKANGYQEYKASFLLYKSTDNKFRGALGDGSSSADIVTGTTIAQQGDWYLVAFCWDADVSQLYVNATKEGEIERTVDISTNSQPMAFGYNYSYATGGPVNKFFHNGNLGLITIFDRKLSAEEIDAIYHRREYSPSPPTWSFSTFGIFDHDSDFETPVTIEVDEFSHDSDFNAFASNPNESLAGNYDHDSDLNAFLEIDEFAHDSGFDAFASNPNESLAGNFDHDSNLDSIGVFGEFTHDTTISAYTSNPNESIAGSYDHDSNLNAIAVPWEIEGTYDHDIDFDTVFGQQDLLGDFDHDSDYLSLVILFDFLDPKMTTANLPNQMETADLMAQMQRFNAIHQIEKADLANQLKKTNNPKQMESNG